MKKLSKKQKLHNIRKSKKKLRQLTKRNKKKKRRKQKNQNTILGHSYSKIHYLVAPATLSLLDNERETLNFFNKAIEISKKCNVNHCIYLNLFKVEHISADAVMYIFAFINNCKRLNILNVNIEGNLPQKKEVRYFLEDFGFYSYVKGLNKTHEQNNKERIQIKHGKNANGNLVSKICDFANNIFKQNNLLGTKRLYPMLIELMTNVKQHAYNNYKGKSIMDSNWYIYTENTTNSISFVFLDTGVGIPTTMWYNHKEKLINLLPTSNRDASYIASALRGAVRSETQKSYRGKGLPGIYQDSVNGQISNMCIISGKGKCVIKNDGSIEEATLPMQFEGTLFCWEYTLENRR